MVDGVLPVRSPGERYLPQPGVGCLSMAGRVFWKNIASKSVISFVIILVFLAVIPGMAGAEGATKDLQVSEGNSPPDNETLLSLGCFSSESGTSASDLRVAALAAVGSTSGSCVGDGRGLEEIHAPANSMWAGRGPWGWFYGTDASGNPNWVPTNPSGVTCVIVDTCGYGYGAQWQIKVRLPDGTIKDSVYYDLSQYPAPPGRNAQCFYLFDAGSGTTPPSEPSPYMVSETVSPYPPFMLDMYQVSIKVKNPRTYPLQVSLKSEESGRDFEHEDIQLIPTNPLQTKTISGNGGEETFVYNYRHKWRWLKDYEDLIALESPFPLAPYLRTLNQLGIATEMKALLAVESMIRALTVMDAKYDQTYVYHLSSTTISGLKDITVPVEMRLEKKVALATSFSYMVGGAILTRQGLAVNAAPGVGQAIYGLLFVDEFFDTWYAGVMMKAAIDPDPDYAVNVYLEPISIPELDQFPESPLKDFVGANVPAMGDMQAFVNSWVKYLGAVEAGDSVWEENQLIATYYYLGLLKEDFQTMSDKFDPAMEYLRTEVPEITPEEISIGKLNLRENGLPQIEKDLMERFGYSEYDMDTVKEIALLVPDEMIIDYESSIRMGLDGQIKGINQLFDSFDEKIVKMNFIPATIDIDPDTLNLRSNGKWITAYIGVQGHVPEDIDLSSLKLNGIVSPVVERGKKDKSTLQIGDFNNDGSPELMVKFDRKEVQKIMRPGKAVVIITGNILDDRFKGSDVINIIP